MQELYIGLMSGTSADGIDAALVDLGQKKPRVIATHYLPYAENLQQQILALSSSRENTIEHLAQLDVQLGHAFADAVQELLRANEVRATDVHAIGSHGQTVRHLPERKFTLQIADPNIIAARTNITTVADFRRRDIALGGHGAPLVPAFHHAFFHDGTNLAIVNIGGIANVTLLHQEPILGFDTGPGNGLLNAWIRENLNVAYDDDGAWARKGRISEDLLKRLLTDPYFKTAPPKSTGPEYFNLTWLEKYLEKSSRMTPADVQATLSELTAQTIVNSVKQFFGKGKIILCGGGVRNAFLIERITKLSASDIEVYSSEEFGLHPDWVEAVAFAWLAKQTLEKRPGNIASVTGATSNTILGGVYYA